MIFEHAIDEKDMDFVLADSIPGVHMTSGLVSQGGTAIQHYISRWLFLDVYLVLSFEIVYGKHQASLTVVGDSGAMCENILKAQLQKVNITAKTDLERFERFRKNKAIQALEESDPQSDIRYNYLTTIANCYQTGNFDALRPLLANDCELSSQRRFDSENGCDAVMAYYEKKGISLREGNNYPVCTIVELRGNIGPSVPSHVHIGGNENTDSSVRLMYTGGKLCLYMEQVIDDQKNGTILDLTLDTDSLISQIDLCMPGLFRFAPYKKQNTVSDFEVTVLKELREEYIGKIADVDCLDEDDYSEIEGGLRIAWETERDYYPTCYAFEIQLDEDNAITDIGCLDVERMTGEDATSSTWEDVDPDEWDYGEMEDKLSEFCVVSNEDED